MDFTGRYEIPAPREAVWAALNDPAVLQSCIPGCDSVTREGEHRFAATATLRIGPVKATFRANVEQTELDPPRRCVLRGEGQGGAAGFASGLADVVLDREGDSTILTYTARATIAGKLAQIGQRLIDGAARQIADDFFARFAAQVSARETPEVADVSPEEIPPEPVGSPADVPDEPARGGVAPEIWVIGLIAIVAILLLLFGMTL